PRTVPAPCQRPSPSDPGVRRALRIPVPNNYRSPGVFPSRRRHRPVWAPRPGGALGKRAKVWLPSLSSRTRVMLVSNHRRTRAPLVIVVAAAVVIAGAAADKASRPTRKKLLVELYTSQG